MKKVNILLVCFIICSFLVSGCSKKTDSDAKLINGVIAEENLPSCILLGTYQGAIVEIPKIKEVTEKDIQEQIEYALEKSGESSLTEQNVKLISGYDTIEKYTLEVKKSLEKMYQTSYQMEIMNRAWDAALERATLLQYPKSMFDVQLSKVTESYEGYTQLLGKSYEEVLNYFGITQKDIQVKALNYVKSDLLVYAIANAENISVDNDEYQQMLNERMKSYNVNSELALKEALGMDLQFAFLADKVMQFVYDNVEIAITE